MEAFGLLHEGRMPECNHQRAFICEIWMYICHPRIINFDSFPSVCLRIWFYLIQRERIKITWLWLYLKKPNSFDRIKERKNFSISSHSIAKSKGELVEFKFNCRKWCILCDISMEHKHTNLTLLCSPVNP